jgi:hypothetical protein
MGNYLFLHELQHIFTLPSRTINPTTRLPRITISLGNALTDRNRDFGHKMVIYGSQTIEMVVNGNNMKMHYNS